MASRFGKVIATKLHQRLTLDYCALSEHVKERNHTEATKHTHNDPIKSLILDWSGLNEGSRFP
jgi:hypothetical protein